MAASVIVTAPLVDPRPHLPAQDHFRPDRRRRERLEPMANLQLKDIRKSFGLLSR
jgi:hypothetical protein